MSINPFHLAFAVRDLEETRVFYRDLLGCALGRETAHWLDFDFFGHQLSAHVRPNDLSKPKTGDVDGDHVPIPHFGAVLDWDVWHTLAKKLEGAGVDFVLKPKIRFEGQPGEQGTFFLYDPSGNALEFKTFKDMSNLFAKQ